MDAISPTAPQRNRPAQGAPMTFTWRRCAQHWWLGVSILQVGESTPVCYTETGLTPPVDRAEPERAA